MKPGEVGRAHPTSPYEWAPVVGGRRGREFPVPKNRGFPSAPKWRAKWSLSEWTIRPEGESEDKARSEGATFFCGPFPPPRLSHLKRWSYDRFLPGRSRYVVRVWPEDLLRPASAQLCRRKT